MDYYKRCTDYLMFQQVPSKHMAFRKILEYLKCRHLNRQFDPLSFDELLHATHLTSLCSSLQRWLRNEALLNNPRVAMHTENGKYSYKPSLPMMLTKQDLLRELRSIKFKGLGGGLLLDDIKNSLPNSDLILRKIAHKLVYIDADNKGNKKLVYYKDEKSLKMKIDQDIKLLWHSAGVDKLSNNDIERYVKQQGKLTMPFSDEFSYSAKCVLSRYKRKSKQPISDAPKHWKKMCNEHVQDILQTYRNEFH